MDGIAVKKKEANRWAGVFQGDLDSINKGSCCGGTGDWGGRALEGLESFQRL